MKRLVTMACALAMSAGLSYGSGLGVFVSQWSPDEGDDTMGAGAKLVIGADVVAMEIRGSYFDEDDVTVIPLDVGLVLNLPLGEGPLGLYAMGGASWYFLDADGFDLDDEAGWYAGGGLKLAISEGLSVFGEAQYRSLEYTAEGDSLDDLEKRDVDFSALTYNVGLLFEF